MEELSRPAGIQSRTPGALFTSLVEILGTPLLILAVTLVGLWLCADGMWPDLTCWR
jgi:hypothetical protein